MRRRDPLPLVAYEQSIQFIYPKHLRDRYQDQMLQTARDANSERTHTALHFWAHLFSDLLRSSLQEHTRMFRNQLFARPVYFYAAAFALILTAMGFPAALTIQQAIRGAADQPQIQMAERYSAQLASGEFPLMKSAAQGVDPSTSLEPFVTVYSSDRHVVFSTGYIGSEPLILPKGVVDYLQSHDVDKFTWQPRTGVRIAAVARRFDGAQPGVVLVGRSLAVVQQQQIALRRGTFISWFCLMALLALGAVLLDRAYQPRNTPSPTQA
jgi:hypothetical protein